MARLKRAAPPNSGHKASTSVRARQPMSRSGKRRWRAFPVKSPLHWRVPPALMQGTKARFRLEMRLSVHDENERADRSKTVVSSPHVKRLPPQGVQSVVQLGLRANWQH